MLPLNPVSPSPRNDPDLRPTGLKRIAAGFARRRARIMRGLAAVGTLGLGGWAAAVVLPAAPFLAVDEVVVHGNERLSEGEVLALLPGLRGAGILSVDIEDHRRRLSASPWLVDGVLRRRLPSTIEVFVTERRPIALARFGGRLFLLDASGAIVDGYGPRFAGLDFPIVDGLTGGAGTAEVVDPRRLALTLRLLADLSGEPAVLGAVSQVDVADPADAVVLLDDDVVLLHLGAERFLARLRLYAELAPVLREQVRDIDEVDLRFDPRVVVRSRTDGAEPAPSRPGGVVADGASARRGRERG